MWDISHGKNCVESHLSAGIFIKSFDDVVWNATKNLEMMKTSFNPQRNWIDWNNKRLLRPLHKSVLSSFLRFTSFTHIAIGLFSFDPLKIERWTLNSQCEFPWIFHQFLSISCGVLVFPVSFRQPADVRCIRVLFWRRRKLYWKPIVVIVMQSVQLHLLNKWWS